jgi:hypothetical protein
MKKNTETLICASKEVSLGVNTKKTGYARTLLSRHQNAEQHYNKEVANRCANVAQFKYFGTTNLILEEIKRRWISGNAYYHSLQNFLLSHLLFEKVDFITYKTTNLLVVFYGCGTWYLTLREEHGLRLFEN